MRESSEFIFRFYQGSEKR